MTQTPLMPKATAVWLVEHTALSFEQIAEFCGLHVLEVKGIADGDVAHGIKGMDPISSGQLTREEIQKAQDNPNYRLQLAKSKVEIPAVKTKRAPKYTPLSRRHDRPNAILWLLAPSCASCATRRSCASSAPPSRPSRRSATAPIGTRPICSRRTRLRWACARRSTWTPKSARPPGALEQERRDAGLPERAGGSRHAASCRSDRGRAAGNAGPPARGRAGQRRKRKRASLRSRMYSARSRPGIAGCDGNPNPASWRQRCAIDASPRSLPSGGRT